MCECANRKNEAIPPFRKILWIFQHEILNTAIISTGHQILFMNSRYRPWIYIKRIYMNHFELNVRLKFQTIMYVVWVCFLLLLFRFTYNSLNLTMNKIKTFENFISSSLCRSLIAMILWQSQHTTQNKLNDTSKLI